ncbi:uncharacterized protein UTRI_01061 [Ustilago trichophora]|uniref:Uncharacterized protein n=1 Tax=Ustilago trichophora TaxID=86804 RepID=A0A5C3DVD4_9BASI|nr:uncharacterized protein UTRI_01061 [Ustilago trichophora]
MKTSFLLLLAALAISVSTTSAAVADPTFLGLVTDDEQYHALCDVGRESALNDIRMRACFTIADPFDKIFREPYNEFPFRHDAKKLNGYVDNSGKNFVLFDGSGMRMGPIDHLSVNGTRVLTDWGWLPDPNEDRPRPGCSYICIRYDKTLTVKDKSIEVVAEKHSELFCPGRDQPFEVNKVQ